LYFKILKKVNAIILAAGNSQRMNFPKAFLLFEKEKTFLEKILETYQLFDIQRIAVVLNEKNYHLFFQKNISLPQNAFLVKNLFPEKEKFYSLKIGLESFSQNYFENTFLQPVDNPFVDEKTLSLLAENVVENGFTVPTFQQKGGHPILIHRNVVKKMAETKDSAISLREWLKNFERKNIEVKNPLILCNINTLQDYQQHFCL